MDCLKCGFSNPDSARFCAGCGASVASVKCPHCQSTNASGSRFCNSCGNSLAVPGQQHEPIDSPANPSRAERRLLTVMFCDLVDSTSIVEDLDPEETRSIIRDFQSQSRAVIEQYGGRITEYLGDGIVAQFTRHETNAERAINSALELIRKLKESDIKFGTESKKIQVRCGIATGMAVVGDMLGDTHIRSESAIGLPLNLAARIQNLANPDEIIIAGDTHRLTRGLFEFEDIGLHTLKGIKNPQQVWRVLKEKHVSSRFIAHAADITPMVDRQEAMDFLLEAWDRSKNGQAATVVFSGEAGIGKSRILQELDKKIANDTFFYLDYQCAPYHVNTSLYPLISRFENAAQFEHGDSNEQRLAKLESLIRPSASDFEGVMPAFASLLGLKADDKWPTPKLDPEEKKQWIFNALINNMFSLAIARPLLIKIEDVHWIDPTTLELMSRMVKALPGHPILLLITTRPGFKPDFMDESHVSLLEIDRLPEQYTAQLVKGVKGSDTLPVDVLEEVIKRTEGIPLFIEELSKSLLEGMTSEGSLVDSSLLAKKDIPTTLHDSLLSRLDRLPNESRLIAQLAAVIGRQFSFDLLEQVADYKNKNLYQDLTPLLESQLVFQDKAPPSAEFSFKHALVRDVAYENLLQSERVDIHKRIAEAIEGSYPEIIKNTPELVARHFTEGRQYEKAVQYWLEAGKKASQSSANVEARSHLETAVELLSNFKKEQKRDELELEILIYLGPLLKILEGTGAQSTRSTYDRIIELCDVLPDSPLHFTGLWGRWHNSLSFKDDYGIGWTQKLDKLAQRLNDDGYKLQACHCKWTTLFHLGEFSTAYNEIKKGREYYDKSTHSNHASLYGGHDPNVCAYGFGCLVLWLMGFPEKALVEAYECANWADELNHTGSLLQSIEANLLLHQFRKDPDQLIHWTDSLEKFCANNKLPEYEAMIDIHRGWSFVKLGKIDQGLELMKRGYNIRVNISGSEDTLLYADMFADVFSIIHEYENALEYIDRALDVSDAGGFYYWLAELYRRKAVVFLSMDNEVESRKSVKKALDISKDQNSKMLQLRSAITLVELNIKFKSDKLNISELKEIFDSFQEGFKTPELIKAKSLLNKHS